jgi:hypothetical protein
LYFALSWNTANEEHRHYPENVSDLITSLTLGLAGIQGLSLLGLPQAEASARTFLSDMEQNLYRPSAFVFAQLFMSLATEIILLIPIVVFYFLILGLHEIGTIQEASSIFFYFGGLLLFVAVISEMLVLSAAMLSRNYSAMYIATGFVQFLFVMFSGGVNRICHNVKDVVAGGSWISPTKIALDGLLLTTVDQYTYYDSDNNGISGHSILQDVYCVNVDNDKDNWRHVSTYYNAFVILGCMLGALLVLFFFSARARQTGSD